MQIENKGDLIRLRFECFFNVSDKPKKSKIKSINIKKTLRNLFCRILGILKPDK